MYTFLTVFPNNELGNGYIKVIDNLGINTKFIVKSNEDLIGSMYVKDNSVIYQRKHSAFSYIKDINLEDIFSINYNWVHLTGITPSLNENCKKQWLNLIDKALLLKIPVSIDLNYRPALCSLKHLWSTIRPYVGNLELFLLSVKDINDICKLENISTLLENSSLVEIMLNFAKKFNIKRLVICIKDILEDKSQNRYSLMIYNNNLFTSKVKNHTPIEHIGGGDAYIGSLINSILKGKHNILDEADNYTIEIQNHKEIFNKKNINFYIFN